MEHKSHSLTNYHAFGSKKADNKQAQVHLSPIYMAVDGHLLMAIYIGLQICNGTVRVPI